MEQDNLNQLKKLARVFNTDNVITSDEIEQVLSGILTIMSSFKKDNENLTKETRDYVNELLDKVIEEKNILKSDTEVKANEISKDVQAKLDSKLEEVKKLIKEAKALKPKNGKDADQIKIVKDVLSQIKLPEYKPILLDTPEEVKNKLETLTGDERLDISAIKGADKLATQANLERGISILDQRTQFLINKTNSSTGGSVTMQNSDTNGVAITWANPTTTPQATVVLGDITPNSVVAQDAVMSRTAFILEETNGLGDLITIEAPASLTDSFCRSHWAVIGRV